MFKPALFWSSYNSLPNLVPTGEEEKVEQFHPKCTAHELITLALALACVGHFSGVSLPPPKVSHSPSAFYFSQPLCWQHTTRALFTEEGLAVSASGGGVDKEPLALSSLGANLYPKLTLLLHVTAISD